MSERRYPNESREYRDARDSLLEEGRPDIDTPPQRFRSKFLEEHYLNKE
jgi:hypothetical protein